MVVINPIAIRSGRWFSPGPPVSSTNKTDSHDITEILLKVALNTTKSTNQPYDHDHGNTWQFFFAKIVPDIWQCELQNCYWLKQKVNNTGGIKGWIKFNSKLKTLAEESSYRVGDFVAYSKWKTKYWLKYAYLFNANCMSVLLETNNINIGT